MIKKCYINTEPNKIKINWRRLFDAFFLSSCGEYSGLDRKRRRGVRFRAFASRCDASWLIIKLYCTAFSKLFQIIEKRRRDKINFNLSELRRLVPDAAQKQVNSRIFMRFQIIRVFRKHLGFLSHLGR